MKKDLLIFGAIVLVSAVTVYWYTHPQIDSVQVQNIEESSATTSSNVLVTNLVTREWLSYEVPIWGMSFEYPSWWRLEQENKNGQIWLFGDGYEVGISPINGRGIPDYEFTIPTISIIGGEPVKRGWQWNHDKGFSQLFSLSDNVCLGRHLVTVANRATTSTILSDKILNSIKCKTKKELSEFVHIFVSRSTEVLSENSNSFKLKVDIDSEAWQQNKTNTVSGSVIVNVFEEDSNLFKNEEGNVVFYATFDPSTNEYSVVRYGGVIYD